MKSLFDNCKLGNLSLNSRVIRTALWESQQNDLNAICERYDKIASSGVGLIITELYSIYSNDKFSEYSFKMDNANFQIAARKIVEICHNYSVPILGQLEFIKYNRGIDLDISVNDLTVEDIRKIQSDIIKAAQKLQFLGFDGFQLQIGNNFFLSKFINPYFNQRSDEYGGDTFNRMRLILELIKVMKDNLNLHISCKINMFDGKKEGFGINESIESIKLLKKVGVDSIQITRPLSPLYFTKKGSSLDETIDYTIKLIDLINIPVIVGGGFFNLSQINEVLNKSNIKFISMYRPFVNQGNFLKEWKINNNGKSKCIMCNNCYRTKKSYCFH